MARAPTQFMLPGVRRLVRGLLLSLLLVDPRQEQQVCLLQKMTGRRQLLQELHRFAQIAAGLSTLLSLG